MTSRSEPDVLIATTSMADLEAKMGIPPLEGLLAERDAIVRDLAPLRARHGPGGSYGDLRKIELCKVAALIRAEAAGGGRKLTEAAIEESSHADPRYADYVIQATEEKARYFELENRIQGIADTVLRANAIARYLAAEAHL